MIAAALPGLVYGLYVAMNAGSVGVLSLLLGMGYAAPSLVTIVGSRRWARDWMYTSIAALVTLPYFLVSIQVWLTYLQPGEDSVALAIVIVPFAYLPPALLLLALAPTAASRMSEARQRRRTAQPGTVDRAEVRRWIIVLAAVPGVLFGLYAVAVLGNATGILLGAAYAAPSVFALWRVSAASMSAIATCIAAGAALVQFLIAAVAWQSMDGVLLDPLPGAAFVPVYVLPALMGGMYLGVRAGR